MPEPGLCRCLGGASVIEASTPIVFPASDAHPRRRIRRPYRAARSLNAARANRSSIQVGEFEGPADVAAGLDGFPRSAVSRGFAVLRGSACRIGKLTNGRGCFCMVPRRYCRPNHMPMALLPGRESGRTASRSVHGVRLQGRFRVPTLETLEARDDAVRAQRSSSATRLAPPVISTS